MGLREISPRPTAGMMLVRQAGPFSRETRRAAQHLPLRQEQLIRIEYNE